MNKTPEEARGVLEPLIDQYARECADIQGRPYPAKLTILDAADAYALAAHVEACGHYQPLHQTPGLVGMGKRCGDGWYCDGAKKYMKEERNVSRT